MNRIKSIYSFFFMDFFSDLKEKRTELLKDTSSSLYRFLFALTFICLLFLMPMASLDYGRSTDETFSESYGRDILAYYKSGGKDTAVFDLSIPSYKDLIYYGLSFDFFCAVVNEYISPFDDFQTRHFLNALVGLLGILIASLIGKRYGGWRSAWFILLLMAVTARYFAHSMNNAKDIPLATAYIAAIYFLLKFLEELPAFRWKTVLLLSLTIGVASSVRIGGMILFAYTGLFAFIHWLYSYLHDKERTLQGKTLKNYILSLSVIGAGAYLLAIIFWPYALQHPFSVPFQALRMFEDSDLLMTHYELFEGKLMNMDLVPWYYILKYLWISLPLIVLIGFLTSIKTILSSNKKTKIVLLILLFVTFFPIFYAAVKSSKLYNGWRHFLFIYPSLAVLAGLGWNDLFKKIKTKTLGIGVVLLFSVLFIKPLIWMIRNHPNQLVYFNEMVGGVAGAYGNYELDYLSFSGREATGWLTDHLAGTNEKYVVASNIETQTLDYYARKSTDNLEFVWVKPIAYGIVDWDYMILTNRSMSKTQIENNQYPPKGSIYTIQVDDVPICAVVKKENNFKHDAYKAFLSSDYQKAKMNLYQAINYDKNDPENYTLMGTILTSLKEYDSALVMLQKAIELFPENFYAYDKLGVLYMFWNKNKKAIDALRKAIYLRTNYSNAYLNLAGAFQNVAQYDSALYYYDIAHAMMPKNIELQLNTAECLIAIGQTHQAFALYERILQEKPSHEKTLQKKQELKTYLENKQELDQMNVQLRKEIMLAEQYMSNNQFDSVIATYTRILSMDQQNVFALVNRGVAKLNMEQYKSAQKDLEKALTLDSSSHYLYYNLGLAYANTRKYQKALDCYNKAFVLEPNDLTILHERAKLNIHLGKYTDALKDCNNILSKDPNRVQTLYSRAWLYKTMGKNEESMTDLNKLLQLSPSYALAYDMRSLLFYEQKNYAAALQDVEKALQLGHKIDPRFVEYLRSMRP
jgi:tetratricopeptide (TPR) repeat protein